MNLVFIYGPPAVGKLTVAKELEKITAYKLFHNHLTVDLVSSIFPMGTKNYSDLVGKIRLDLIEAAASAIKNGGIIFTFVYGVETYGGRSDDLFIRKIIDKVKKYNGRILFVKLTCSEKVLHKRLKHPSRQMFRKLRNISRLKQIKKKYDLDSTIPFEKSLIIDNTSLSARKVALLIARYFKI